MGRKPIEEILRDLKLQVHNEIMDDINALIITGDHLSEGDLLTKCLMVPIEHKAYHPNADHERRFRQYVLDIIRKHRSSI